MWRPLIDSAFHRVFAITSMRVGWQRLCTVACAMNTARTWLSLVASGLTVATIHNLHIASGQKEHTSSRVEEALALVSLGILLIATAHHFSFISGRRRRRGAVSLVVALSLLMLGLIAISSMAFAVGKLG
jgi:hypothetical protein